MIKRSSLHSLVTGMMLATSAIPVLAEDEQEFDLWSMCTDSRSVFNQKPVLPQISNPEQLDISANSIQSIANGLSLFENNVLIEKHGFRLTTDKLTYDKNTSKISLPHATHIENEKLIIDSEKGEMNSNTDNSTFSNVRFVIQSSHMQGSSPEIKLLGKDSTLLSQVNFSSCEPGKESWIFSANDLKLDHIDESGTARHVVIRVKDVPIFYLPYISFPLGDRRRSGVLTPELKFSSSRNGNEFSLPYYWNIAPNQDAIITPAYLEKRGILLKTNYRYLTTDSNGELDIEYLDDDKITGEERYLSKLIHHTELTDHLDFNINATAASDSHYLDDFGQSLELSSISHLQQSAYFQYHRGNWRSKLLEQNYQTTDDTIALESRPYRRRPQLTVSGTESLTNNGLKFQLTSEWVNFTHQDSTKEQGYRTDLYPKLSWPNQGSYWFFTPTVGHRFTAYDVTDTSGTGAELDLDDRSLAIIQMDSGLFFERQFSDTITQTLEPRLYYLNVPSADQSLIPLFDSSEPDFSFAQMFRDNRFNGADRVADANQLTTAITTRLLDDNNGNERFSASIGQIHYFDDREVSIKRNYNNSDIQTASSSDIAAEFVIRDENWSYRLSALQNTENNKVDKGNFLYHYQSDNRHIFNLGYRFRRDLNPADSVDDEIDQSDLSFKWPLSDHWSMLARWNYSLKDKRDLENIAGFEYNTCCWAFRVIGRGHLTQDENNEDVFDRSVIFTLILKGFGSTGKANQELERAILGFQPEY